MIRVRTLRQRKQNITEGTVKSADSKRDDVWPRINPYASEPHEFGYAVPASLRAAINQARRGTSLAHTLMAICGDYVIALGAPVIAFHVVGASFLNVIGMTLALILVGRAQRGMEVLVHEASHLNWTRKRLLNDLLAVSLAAAPIFADLETYRTSHKLHHIKYATEKDIDRQRYLKLGLDDLDRTSALRFFEGVVRRLPKYWWGWYSSVGVDLKVIARFIFWLTAVFATIAALSGSSILAAFVVGNWVASLLFVLPVIRFVGEAAEHVYIDGTTVFDTTVSNVGCLHRLLIHPHGDGYHLVHHMWQTVPHFALGRVHRLLIEHDPDGYGARVKTRKRVLENPEVGAQSSPRTTQLQWTRQRRTTS